MNVWPIRSAMNSVSNSPKARISAIANSLALQRRKVRIGKSRRLQGRPLAHPVAAVDIEGLRHNVVALGRCEKHRSAGVVFGKSHPAVRHGFADQALLLAD